MMDQFFVSTHGATRYLCLRQPGEWYGERVATLPPL